MTLPVETIFGQPSWRLEGDLVSAHLTCQGGQLAPVTFRDEDGEGVRSPYYINPWHHETLEPGKGDNDAEVLHALRGDFFCLPFGEGPLQGHEVPLHGESSTRAWEALNPERSEGAQCYRFRQSSAVPGAQIIKALSFKDGHRAIYQEHTITGFDDEVPLGHHAILPGFDEDPWHITTSSLVELGVMPGDDLPPPGERHALKKGAFSSSLSQLPLADGSFGDGRSFPARDGHTDIIALFHQGPLAWTCAARRGELWFSIKDARLLPSTVFWMENRGRDVSPWNGRNCCIGIEDTCGHFASGLPTSAQPNSLSEKGIPTAMKLSPTTSTRIRSIQGCLAKSEDFGPVMDLKQVSEDRWAWIDESHRVLEFQLSAQWVLDGAGSPQQP